MMILKVTENKTLPLQTVYFLKYIFETNPHKKLTDINQCLTDPANQCLTNV